MEADIRTEEEITISGNPGRPVGEDGERMLGRMNESHSGVTGLPGFPEIVISSSVLLSAVIYTLV